MDLINQILVIPTESCDEHANRLFAAASGIDKAGKKYEKMREEAYAIRARIRPGIQIKAIYSYFENPVIDGISANIGGRTFHCNAFGQIPAEKVTGAYVHMVTAGEYHLDSEPIMNQLFADFWGSAFTEAGRNALLDMLEGSGRLSEGFGPGYYGMNAIQMKDIAALLDTGAIGVTVRDSGVLVPLKSCGGISFRVGSDYMRLNVACADCRGNQSGCMQCSIRHQLNREQQ